MDTKNLSLTNNWEEQNLSTKIVSVDELAKKYDLIDLDFIKIDTDGADRDVLESAREIIHNAPVLGIFIEINFIGNDKSPNSFHSVDKVLRSWGFELFNITSRKYSSHALPAPFEIDCIAQTSYGKIQQGDALYLRDPMSINEGGAPQSPKLSTEKLLKLACIYEIFNLPDQAAELLLTYKDQLSSIIDVTENLNLLTKELTGRDISYNEYVNLITPALLLPDGEYGKNNSPENYYLKIMNEGKAISKKMLKDHKLIEEDFYNWRINFNNPSDNHFRLLAHASFNLDSLQQQYHFVKKYEKDFIKSALLDEHHVFYNYFLNLWEYTHGETYLESYPWDVAIPITDICNARCTFCDSWLRGTGITSVDQLYVYEKPLRHARTVTLQGHGEPLVNPNIDEILTKIGSWVTTMGRISIITNGSKLAEKLNLLIDSKVEVFNISLNAATPETHDIVMGLGPNSFNQIIDSIKKLISIRDTSNKNLEITISLVMTKDNLHEVVNFIELAEELTVNKIYIRTLSSQPDNIEELEQMVNSDDPRQYLPVGLNYHLLSPTLHEDYTTLVTAILAKINNCKITIECQPETWGTKLFGEKVERLLELKPEKIYFIPREQALVDKNIRQIFKKEKEKLFVTGKGKFRGYENYQFSPTENPYNRKTRFECRFVYHKLMSFETLHRLSPCCYLVDVPGHEPIVMDTTNFMDYWNSDAMVTLRKSLIDGPMYTQCKKCPNQG